MTGQSASKTGAFWPQNAMETGRYAASVLCPSEEQELKKGSARNDWINCWDERFSRDSSANSGASIFTATAVLTPGTNITLETVGVQDTGRLTVGTRASCDDMWSKHNIDDSWNSSHWKTIG